MILMDDYPQLKKEIEECRRTRDVAKGGLSLLFKRLKQEHKVGTLREAKALLERLKALRLKKARKIAAAHKAFAKTWPKKKRPK